MDKITPFYRLLVFIILTSSVIISSSLISTMSSLIVVVLIIAFSSFDKKKIIEPIYKIRWFLALIFVLNALFSDSSDLFSFFIFRVSRDGITGALMLIYKIVLISALSFSYTECSNLSEINESFYILLFPLKLLFIPVDVVSSVLSLSLHLVDEFRSDLERLEKIRRLRGVDESAKGIKERAISYKAIVIPIFIIAFRRSDELSLSLQSRGYRVKMRVNRSYLRMGAKELFALFISISVLIGGILC